ncbi:hypothetical protein F2P79_009422 [Pimephales promelas]|nr:hypothetical protein F2P79_009422 [Pimephales promelas]
MLDLSTALSSADSPRALTATGAFPRTEHPRPPRARRVSPVVSGRWSGFCLRRLDGQLHVMIQPEYLQILRSIPPDMRSYMCLPKGPLIHRMPIGHTLVRWWPLRCFRGVKHAVQQQQSDTRDLLQCDRPVERCIQP